MDPIFLYPEENKGKYYISIGKSNDYLSIPGGNLVESHNEALLEELSSFYKKRFNTDGYPNTFVYKSNN